MKKYAAIPIVLALLLLFCSAVYAAVDTLEGEELTSSATIEGVSTTDTVEGQVLASGVVAYCAGGESFCATFETDAEISWDASPATEDCPPDAADEWCDYDNTTAAKGTYALSLLTVDGINELYKSFTDIDTWTLEYWYWSEDVTSSNGPLSRYGNNNTFGHWNNASAYIEMYFNDSAVYYTCSSTTNGFSGLSTSTWYHIKVYYVEETSSGANDGTVTVWIATTDALGDNDKCIDESAVDTGQDDMDDIQFRSTSGIITRYDNVKIN